MSRFNVLGPYSRHKMKRTSPFTSLLLEISLGLLEEDVSNLKLALQVDKFVKKIHLKKLKNGGEVLSHMHEENIITATDTEFLENVLMQIGRQDLVKKIEKYHAKRAAAACISDDTKLSLSESENTVPKQLLNTNSNTPQMLDGNSKLLKPEKRSSNPKSLTDPKTTMQQYTALKDPVSAPNQQMNVLGTGNTHCKEIYFGSEVLPSNNYSSDQDLNQYGVGALPSSVFDATCRSSADGQSFSGVFQCRGPPDTSDSPNSSQSDVDMKAAEWCSQASQMSVSDDEKLGFQDKAWAVDGDSSNSMQFSQ